MPGSTSVYHKFYLLWNKIIIAVLIRIEIYNHFRLKQYSGLKSGMLPTLEQKIKDNGEKR